MYHSGEHWVLVLVHFRYPFGIATNPSNGHVYVIDTGNHRVQEFTNLGVFVRQWGTLGPGPGAFQYPFGIATNPSNNHVYVADTYNQRIQEFTNLGVFVRSGEHWVLVLVHFSTHLALPLIP